MKRFALLSLLALLAACQEAPKAYTPLTFDYSGQPPIMLNVSEVRVIEEYRAPLTYPNVEHEFPTSLAEATKRWLNGRLRAGGTQGVLEVTIDNASAKVVELPKTKGVKGLFINDQDTRYDASLHVTYKLYNGIDALAVANGDVLVNRSKTISEKATVEDHEKLYDQITKEMMADFSKNSTQRLQQYFSAYILR